MNKVIIDGVDVNECEFCVENPLHEIKHSCNVRGYEKDNGLHIHLKCKNNPDCYYKQLKRLQEQFEEYKSDIAMGIECITCTKENENCRLQVENERLKEEISNIHHDCNRKGCRYYDDDSYKVFYECKAKKALYLNANSVTTKYANILKTLQEIRELIKKLDLSLGCDYGDYDCDNCSDINEETVCKIKLQKIILDKINEVIGVEE